MKENKPVSGLKRYQGMLLSFVAYTLVVVGLLYYNYRISQTSEMIGYQNDIIGRLSDDTIMMHSAANEVLADALRGRNEKVDQQAKTITDTLAGLQLYFDALERGGSYGDLGYDTPVDALTNPEHIKRLASFNNIINNFKLLWTEAFQVPEGSEQASIQSFDLTNLSRAVDLINGSMNNIYDIYIEDTWSENLAQMAKYAAYSRNIMIAIGVITALYFIVFVFYFVRRLGVADRKLALATREIEDIMETVKEGLFLVDKELTVGSQHSSQLKHIIGQDNIANQKLEQVLGKVIPGDALESTRLFINQLMNKKVVPELIDTLNPISRVRMKTNFSDPERWLSFNFSRVMDQEISRILVSVADITKEVELERRLEEAKAKHDEQIELLSSLLSSDPHLVEAFLEKSRKTASYINNVLREEGYDVRELKRKIDIIFREIHSLKGEASAVKLSAYVSLCEVFENRVQVLKRQPDLTGDDFLSVAVYLEELEVLNDRATTVFSRLGGNRDHGTAHLATGMVDNSHGLDLLNSLAQQAAKRNGKQVRLCSENTSHLPQNVQQPLQDILIQMVRNAVVHGIETPEQRQQVGKQKEGNIRIRFAEKNGQGVLSFEDDGRGIDFDQLARIAKERGIAPDNGDGYSRNKLIAVMFASGVSTVKTNSEDAGRGVGTSIIQDRLRQINGKISVNSQPGQLTRFVIAFPM